ncbi:MAG: methyltransferase domain-containing protein [Candidatus Fermentibacteraceae bacterium]|nr:methyltransferase domain-containing protein [Candidatus Fermentibacteraceae bacterium]MBN2609563.1 methyltransferase domain-containing protein [Candidatus Fermentibacteraceae bacterium]
MARSGFSEADGILVPRIRPVHRGDEYDEAAFETLLGMQRDHFWYRGRHRLILDSLRRELGKFPPKSACPSAIDIGGGCGGWLEYLHERSPALFSELAMGDSSEKALAMAGDVVGEFASRYLLDLMALPWTGEWDVVFLLDVLEHVPDDLGALKKTAEILRPGGLVFITAPALKQFWTCNDRIAGHRRRYSRKDIETLGVSAGLKPVRTSYFMFLLSPLLFLTRMFSRLPGSATREDERALLERTHRVPPRPLNALLSWIFFLETAMIRHLRFPWGTSVLAVLRKDAPVNG